MPTQASLGRHEEVVSPATATPAAATSAAPAAKHEPEAKLSATDKPAASKPTEPAAPRYVVQVGAYADDAKARDVRHKLEKAGLKTYTHVAETKEGKRTRVRIGPFTSKDEADKTVARLKGMNLQATVLTL